MWNSGDATLVHIDVLPGLRRTQLCTGSELVGISPKTLNLLATDRSQAGAAQRARQRSRRSPASAIPLDRRGASLNQFALHPLRVSCGPCRTS